MAHLRRVLKLETSPPVKVTIEILGRALILTSTINDDGKTKRPSVGLYGLDLTETLMRQFFANSAGLVTTDPRYATMFDEMMTAAGF